MMMKVVVFFKSLGRFYLDDLRGGEGGVREFCHDVDLKHIGERRGGVLFFLFFLKHMYVIKYMGA